MTTITANTQTNHRARSLILLVMAAASIGLLVGLRPLIQAAALPVLHPVPRVDLDIKYQALAFGLAFVNLLITYMLFPANFKRFARVGNSQVHPVPVKALGISAKDTWRGVGINFAIVITLVTSIFLYLNVLQGDLSAVGSAVIGFAPFILIFAALNAFTEEAITRFTVVVGFEGVVPRSTVALISALLFGLPHYFGTPGGVVGALMAGFIGWLLAKSIQETEGVWWSWFIHFLQDVVIFIAFFAVL